MMDSVGFSAFDERPGPEPDTRALAARYSSGALGGVGKRTVDLLVAAVALTLLAPLFLLVAVSVKCSGPGPVFYGHKRVGLDGASFRCWKFRSMVTDGDRILSDYIANHPDEREEWETNRKLRNDPRVTRIGSVLRAYSVDELPQLINVLTGDMSIVGPRPVTEDELGLYGNAAALYLMTRPGITGLWQVSGRSDTSYVERVALDTRYVQAWSFWSDLMIILRTIPAVVSSKGSY